MTEPSILDLRLAEIDRRLRTIQVGLAPATEAGGSPPAAAPFPALQERPHEPPEHEPLVRQPPAREPPGRWPAPVVPLDGHPSEPRISDHRDPARRESERLVAELRELAERQERLLTSAQELLSAYAASLEQARAGADPGTAPVTVSAGPFADTDALRRFERSLAAMPEVRQVAVREYQGEDRAVVDVHLVAPIS
jgi:hypothetical protein